MDKRTSDRLARRIKIAMNGMGLESISLDEALMMVEMGRNQAKLRGVLESFPRDNRPSISDMYKKFHGGVQ